VGRSLVALSEPWAIKGMARWHDVPCHTFVGSYFWGLRSQGIPHAESSSNSVVRKDQLRSRSPTCERALSSLEGWVTYDPWGSLYRPRALYKWPLIPMVERENKGKKVYYMKRLKSPQVEGKKQGQNCLLWPESWAQVGGSTNGLGGMPPFF
jgi:hypothetical protein